MHISYLLCRMNFIKMILQKRSNFKRLLENCNSWSHYCFLSMLMLQIMTRGTNTKRPKVVYFRPFDLDNGRPIVCAELLKHSEGKHFLSA